MSAGPSLVLLHTRPGTTIGCPGVRVVATERRPPPSFKRLCLVPVLCLDVLHPVEHLLGRHSGGFALGVLLLPYLPVLPDRWPALQALAAEGAGALRFRLGLRRARALALRPDLVVADEITSGLDVTVKRRVLDLLTELQADFRVAYLFISHDLAVVRQIADRVAVMYLGQIVEEGPTEALFAAPNHPYTRALLAEIPRISLTKRSFHPIKGEIPSPLTPPAGCVFHTRCPIAGEECRRDVPPIRELAPRHAVACHKA